MYIKAEQRAKSIGGFIGDEFMIAMGDVPWIYKKVYLVPGSTLKKKLSGAQMCSELWLF